MDPKRKRLYLILLVLCILATAAILLWGRAKPVPMVVPPTTSGSSGTAGTKARAINPDATYPPPSVFPQSQTINSSVLKSSDFSILQDFNPATLITGELGRDNPFKNY